LSFEFEINDLGEAKKALGIEIERDWKVFLTQKCIFKSNINGYIRFVSTPLAPHFKVKATISLTTIEECECISHVSYASAVGGLMYAMVCTRPDLSQAVNMISRYIHDPARFI